MHIYMPYFASERTTHALFLPSKARKKIPVFQVAWPTLPNGRRPVTFFFNSIVANFAPCVSSRAVPFISVNSVTAADIFQTLELSVCMIVDFLQNGYCHSLSYSNTMPMCSIWLQYHPPPGKGTAVKITGQEKEDKVKKSRHHMEFVNKSSNVFFWSGRNDSKIYSRFAWLQVSAYVGSF